MTLAITFEYYATATSYFTKQRLKTFDCMRSLRRFNQSIVPSRFPLKPVRGEDPHCCPSLTPHHAHRPCGAFHHLLIRSIHYHHHHCWEDVAQINLQAPGASNLLPPPVIYLDKDVKKKKVQFCRKVANVGKIIYTMAIF